MSQPQYPTSHIRLLHRLLLTTGFTATLTAVVSLVGIPHALSQQRGLAKIVTLASGLAVTEASRRLAMSRTELADVTADLDLLDRRENIAWYQKIISNVAQVRVEHSQRWLEENIITDPVSYWLGTGSNGLPGKHLLIVGGTGDGKSTLIQAFASRLSGWQFQVYDCDGTVDDWGFVEPDSRVYDMADIETAMVDDLATLECRILARREAGRRWTDIPRLTIAEELPALVSSSDTAANWVVSHAKRGRKPLCFIAAVAQNDTVKNLGLEGDSDVRDSCFARILLGNKSREYARKMGNDVLLRWLEAVPRGRFIVDGRPCEWVVNGSQPTTSTTQTLPEATPAFTNYLPTPNDTHAHKTRKRCHYSTEVVFQSLLGMPKMRFFTPVSVAVAIRTSSLRCWVSADDGLTRGKPF
jgi:energy-coupling factor transporter ATP-binding protein EcfA2